MRPTEELTTPGGRKVVVYTYLTGREANEIKQEILKVMKIDTKEVLQSASAGKEEIPMTGDLTGEFLLVQERKLVSFLVKSVDGDDKNASDKVFDMSNSEYQYIVKELNRINTGNFSQAK